MKIRMLSLFVAAALAAGAAHAGDKTPAPATPQQQAARAEIDRLVKRIEELSHQLGEGNDVRVIVRTDKQHGPGHMPGAFEWEEGDGERKVVIKRLGPGDAPQALPGDGTRIERIERVGPGGQKWKVEGFPEGEFGFGPGLGIVLAANTAATGVRIAAVTPDSPAMKAGIRTDDVLLQVNGKTIGGNGDAAVENARKLIGDLKQGQVVKLRYARQGKTHDASVRADEIHRVMSFRREGLPGKHRAPAAWQDDERIEHLLPPGVEMDIRRIGPSGDCGKGKDKGKEDCGMPVIYEAFRWQGLNLASIDAGLGRYFGTQQGVLVLSSGEDLKGLQSGDVIQRVGGTAVDSPRDVMRALRDKDAGSQLKFDLMRDKRTQAVSVTVPKSRPLPFVPPPPAPPAPPAAPAPPPPPPSGAALHAPHAAPPAPPAPPRAPAPPPLRESSTWTPAPDAIEEVRVVSIDDRDAIYEIEVTPAPSR